MCYEGQERGERARFSCGVRHDLGHQALSPAAATCIINTTVPRCVRMLQLPSMPPLPLPIPKKHPLATILIHGIQTPSMQTRHLWIMVKSINNHARERMLSVFQAVPS